MYMQTELHGVPIFISVTINRALKTTNHIMNVGCAKSLQANVSVLSFTVFAFWETHNKQNHSITNKALNVLISPQERLFEELGCFLLCKFTTTTTTTTTTENQTYSQ